jgi:hypothetical protein
MKLICENISDVRAVVIPTAVGLGQTWSEPGRVLVTWSSDWQDKYFQIYAAGILAGVTNALTARSMIIGIVARPGEIVGIEVFAVEPAYADEDLSCELAADGRNGTVRISWLKDQQLGLDTLIDIFYDAGTGVIDYSKPLNCRPIRLWRDEYEKAGFGLADMASCDFGFDGAAAPGLGLGSFGLAVHGFDAATDYWQSDQLPAGQYRFAVRFTISGAQNIVELAPVVVRSRVLNPCCITAVSLDGATGRLILRLE